MLKRKKIDYPFSNITPITEVTKNWTTINNKEIISVHPPPESVYIAPHHTNDNKCVAQPFKSIPQKEIDDPSKVPFININSQLNYTNQSLITIGEQLDRIEPMIIKPMIIKNDSKIISIPSSSKINIPKSVPSSKAPTLAETSTPIVAGTFTPINKDFRLKGFLNNNDNISKIQSEIDNINADDNFSRN